jgi:hypothetical protein
VTSCDLLGQVPERETEKRRLARNVGELLQEVRVIQAGVQFCSAS